MGAAQCCSSQICRVTQIQVTPASTPNSSPSNKKINTAKELQEREMDENEDKQRLGDAKKAKKRGGVACESVSTSAIKDYKKPVYKKDAEANKKIKELLKSHEKMTVLFGHLSDSAMVDIVNAFQDQDAKQGQDLIRQGDEGDCLYIIKEGQVDVYVNRPNPDGSMPPGKGHKVVTLGPGALFGELALMYQAPRAATVTVASAGCKMWQLDREPFKMLLAQSAENTYEKYEGWLHEVDILKTLNHFELAQLSETMESELFDTGEEIIKEGEEGDKFYILEDGTASAFIRGAEGEREVKAYSNQGEYFGEIALLNNEPRRATVRATGTGASVATISREDFTNILGPIQDILKQHIDKYPQYKDLLT